jgi:alpha-tubulin suppressor-like RCC1 family protein
VDSWQSISAGGLHTCGIAASGTNAGETYCWGNGFYGQLGNGGTSNSIILVQVSASTGVDSWQSISAGFEHTCAIAATGTNAGKAYCWGLGGILGIGNNDGHATPVPVSNP